MQILTPSQMKNAEVISDRDGISFSQLMENAGFKLAEIIIKAFDNKNFSERKLVFLCGNGNNAGDCFTAIRYLLNQNLKISVALLCGNPKSELAVKNFDKIKDKVTVTDNYNEITELVNNADIICDGVFGTGFHGGLSDSIKKIFAHSQGKYKIAVDIPSGADALDGNISEGTFNADLTLTFGFVKSGMTQYPLCELCGEIITADIGITSEVLEEAISDSIPLFLTDDNFIKSTLKKRKPDSHKGDFGKLISVCGSNQMSGACMMSGKSALRCGVGILVTASSEKCCDRVAVYLPESMTLNLETDENGFILCEENYELLIEKSSQFNAMLIGCGIGVTNDTRKLLYRIIKNAECPLIIDADGINCISNCIEIIKEARYMPILTPHPKEFSRILDCDVKTVQAHRISMAMKTASEYNAVIVLKGAGTVIASPECVYINRTGNSGMSRGGSGDVLAGMTASFYAQGYSAFDSAVISAYLHGIAGDLTAEKYSQLAMLPTDTIDMLGEVFKKYGF